MGRQFQQGARLGLQRQVIPASLPAGAGTLSSSTWKARRTTCSSRATISSPTKMCAASFLKYRALLWGQERFACGRARLRQVMAAAGSKWSAEPGPRKRSYLSKRKMPTWEVNRRATSVSLSPSRTLWSTQVDIRRPRRSAWRGHCSRMFCLTTLRARHVFLITAGHSPTMRSLLLRILTNGKVTEDRVGPHGDLLLEFPYVGPPRQSRLTKAPKTTATQNQT